MTARKRPTCPLCGQAVLVKHPAWISHLFGWSVHLDCVEKAGPGWYGTLLASVGGSDT